MIKFILSFLIILIPSIMFSQTENQSDLETYRSIAKNIVKSALSERKGYFLLQELSNIGHRLNGSPNYYESIEWAEETMYDLKMDSVWLQECKIPHWVRGNIEKMEMIADEDINRTFTIAAVGGSVGTNEEGITAEVIEVTSFDDLDKKKETIKNKIVFYNTPFDISEVNTFKAYGKAVQYRVHGASRAAKYGAAAAIVRSAGSKRDNVPHTGSLHYDENFPKIPAVTISDPEADYLSSTLLMKGSLSLKLTLGCKILPDTIGYNVIGEIRGSEFPNEIVLVGGHFDSWDKGIGMHDDGGPCVQTMEALYLIKEAGIKPKRTIRCVLFTNEENGRSGAVKYAEEADKDSLGFHLAAIESDRGVFTPRGFSVSADSSVIDKMQEWLPILSECLIDWIRPGGSGADVSLIKNTKAKLGYVPDTQRYMDLHHSANDVFEAVHPREMELGSAAIAIMALLISDFGL